MFARKALLVCVSAVTLLTSCSSEAPKKVKEPEKTPDPVGAQYAFHQTYLSARTWAQDLEIFRISSITVEGMKTPPLGKAIAWEVIFVSQAKASAKPYTYSTIEQGNLHSGVFGGLEERWSGTRGQSTAFPTAAFKTDSVKAWAIAAEKSKDYMDKNPDKPITFVLEKTARHPNPAWRVIWGTSAATSNYSVYVDASTGEFLERMH